MKKESPKLRQFTEFKAKHPDAVLLFRCNDWYQAFKEDAEEVAFICNETNIKQQEGLYTVLFPSQKLDIYLPKLIRAGRRVAICEQLEKPK